MFKLEKGNKTVHPPLFVSIATYTFFLLLTIIFSTGFTYKTILEKKKQFTTAYKVIINYIK